MLSEFHLQVCHVCPCMGFQSRRVFWAYMDIILAFREISLGAGCRSQTVPQHVKNWSEAISRKQGISNFSSKYE